MVLPLQYLDELKASYWNIFEPIKYEIDLCGLYLV